MHGGVGDGGNGRSGIEAAVFESVDVKFVVGDIGLLLLLLLSASLVSKVHRDERSWWSLSELLWLLVAVLATKVRAKLMMLASSLKLLLLLMSLSGFWVFAGDGVGAKVGIAVGGGAGHVDNADGV